MGMERSLLILVHVGALEGCTAAPAPSFPDYPGRNFYPIHFKFEMKVGYGYEKKPIDFGACALGGCTAAPKAAPWFPDDPGRNSGCTCKSGTARIAIRIEQ